MQHGAWVEVRPEGERAYGDAAECTLQGANV